MQGGSRGACKGDSTLQLRSLTMSKALAKSSNHPKVEECCDMSFEGLSLELMLCVRIRRERLWCSQQASKRSRQVLRLLVDQTAWDPNLGSRRVLRPIQPRTEVSERQPPFCQMCERKLIGLHAMCKHIERRKTRATTISHGVLPNLKKKKCHALIFPSSARKCGAAPGSVSSTRTDPARRWAAEHLRACCCLFFSAERFVNCAHCLPIFAWPPYPRLLRAVLTSHVQRVGGNCL